LGERILMKMIPPDALTNVSFDPPPGWSQRTIVTFVAPGVSSNPPSIIIVREELPEGETVLQFQLRQIAELGVKVKEARYVGLHGRRALQVIYEWPVADTTFVQTRTFVHTSETSRAVTHITTTCTREDAARMQPLFDLALRSMRVGDARGEREATVVDGFRRRTVPTRLPT
jgi:hypothetical protein